MSKLKPCPCGQIPDSLNIYDANQSGKYAFVQGNCCGEWLIEFRTDYEPLDSEKCMESAIQAWNDTSRGVAIE